MKIPFIFYFKYWLKNSILALGTGLIIGYFIGMFFIIIYYPPYLDNFTISLFLFLIFSQILIFQRFWGKQRDCFEYNYDIYLINKSVKLIVLKLYGFTSFFRYSLDNFSNMKLYQEQICKKLLNTKSVYNNDYYLFLIYIKLAIIYRRNDDYPQEMKFLLLAIKVKPDNFVANYKLAVFHERKGSADNAINHYKAALNDPNINTAIFNDFIISQIDRVNIKGTMAKPPSLD